MTDQPTATGVGLQRGPWRQRANVAVRRSIPLLPVVGFGVVGGVASLAGLRWAIAIIALIAAIAVTALLQTLTKEKPARFAMAFILIGVSPLAAFLIPTPTDQAGETPPVSVSPAPSPRITTARLNLAGRDLTGAKLQGVQWANADLRGTVLTRADLTGANLEAADLRGADLSAACLRGANLLQAKLDGAIITAAEFTGTVGGPSVSPSPTASAACA